AEDRRPRPTPRLILRIESANPTRRRNLRENRMSRLLAIAAALMLPAAVMAETIEGEVDVTGKIPAAGKLHREADPFCAKTPMTNPEVLTKGGKLENVWVHVSKGAKPADVPSTLVEMDQKNCMYTPRMTTAVV